MIQKVVVVPEGEDSFAIQDDLGNHLDDSDCISGAMERAFYWANLAELTSIIVMTRPCKQRASFRF